MLCLFVRFLHPNLQIRVACSSPPPLLCFLFFYSQTGGKWEDFQAKMMMAHIAKQSEEYPLPLQKILPQFEYEIAHLTARMEMVSSAELSAREKADLLVDRAVLCYRQGDVRLAVADLSGALSLQALKSVHSSCLVCAQVEKLFIMFLCHHVDHLFLPGSTGASLRNSRPVLFRVGSICR